MFPLQQKGCICNFTSCFPHPKLEFTWCIESPHSQSVTCKFRKFQSSRAGVLCKQSFFLMVFFEERIINLNWAGTGKDCLANNTFLLLQSVQSTVYTSLLLVITETRCSHFLGNIFRSGLLVSSSSVKEPCSILQFIIFKYII